MNVLIVYAHEEPKSFNGAMKDSAVQVLQGLGHSVVVSDLYAMRFNPVGGKQDFTVLADPDFFKYGVEQTKASEAKTFSAEVAAEQDKLFRADFLIFQFPLWWFGLPAILKGWVDRVFAAGLTYGGGRWYSNGVFKGETSDVEPDDRGWAHHLQSPWPQRRDGRLALPNPTWDALLPRLRGASSVRGLVRGPLFATAARRLSAGLRRAATELAYLRNDPVPSPGRI